MGAKLSGILVIPLSALPAKSFRTHQSQILLPEKLKLKFRERERERERERRVYQTVFVRRERESERQVGLLGGFLVWSFLT
jgi:hypothetical protein